jgi:NH3-dependent NAD+ synthetase
MLGAIMPCHSTQKDEEHAQIAASKFSIPTKIVVLDTAFDTLLRAVASFSGIPQQIIDKPSSAGLR